MSTWLWNNKPTFKEIYPDASQFKDFINEISEAVPLFDLDKVYNAMIRSYEFDKIMHTSKSGFENDLYNLWNDNIFMWNKVYELLNVDYASDMGTEKVTSEIINEVTDRDKLDNENVDRDRTNQVVNDIDTTRSLDQTEYENPQFDNILNSPTRKVVDSETGAEDSTQNVTEAEDVIRTKNEAEDVIRDFTRDHSVKDKVINKNEEIEQYLSIYRRFSYRELVSRLESLFVPLLG